LLWRTTRTLRKSITLYLDDHIGDFVRAIKEELMGHACGDAHDVSRGELVLA
jgi:hypothetical protein